ncbi:hypothetical protein [Siphonobacter sp. SORGH_AS_0500]|uniref:hypothetical protein n=1 Tax=Siphonobacter sp. SORGH_AS_0500 TaxID=1864824 RepID=UPI00285CBC99|nr:hypothetical protein [Siphonobacter sp. SORGH_AS_0500]MDR6194755.1 hypothetical protein [Siphonobacter sp. SORGH_AS_0500]
MDNDEKLSFRVLYFKLSYQMRQSLKVDFCRHFDLSVFSFRKRLEGKVSVSEEERLWVEKFVTNRLEKQEAVA